jgi:hypothetical protein
MQRWEYCFLRLSDKEGAQPQMILPKRDGVEGRGFANEEDESGAAMLLRAIAMLGRDGWELVQADDNVTFWFKRPIEE